MVDKLKILFLAVFFLSSPMAVYCVYALGYDRLQCAIINSYGFSTAMICLYIYPFFDASLSWTERVNKATINWIVWLSVFTEIVFQIPHNLFVKQLQEQKGTALEWPFYTYGLSDSRWADYHGGSGLAPEVWLINVNDGSLGILVALVYVIFRRYESDEGKSKAKILLCLVVLFRDATLWRETVEYFWDHHRKGYPYTTHDPDYRSHATACLWLVNIVWLVAPFVTVLWVYNTINEVIAEKSLRVGQGEERKMK